MAKLADAPIGASAVDACLPPLEPKTANIPRNRCLPRLLEESGDQSVIRLKRFHSFGLGESHADSLLNGLEEMVPDGTVKLGFRAHHPQP